jgi:hypothetical protein
VVAALIVVTLVVAALIAVRSGTDSRSRYRSREEQLADLGVTWEIHASACDTLADHRQAARSDASLWPRLPLYPYVPQPGPR